MRNVVLAIQTFGIHNHDWCESKARLISLLKIIARENHGAKDYLLSNFLKCFYHLSLNEIKHKSANLDNSNVRFEMTIKRVIYFPSRKIA